MLTQIAASQQAGFVMETMIATICLTNRIATTVSTNIVYGYLIIYTVQCFPTADRRTDVRTTYDSNSALALRVSRGKNWLISDIICDKK